jgi:superfamily II DNA or RNA helicase
VGEEYKITEKDIVIKPLSKKLTFLEMKKYILDNFSQFTWPKVKMENKCIPKGGSEIVEFTPTQDFISHFFTPQSAYKGMLLYQTVGTGKTCCAIATATRTFEKEGYTILWVTRASLKSDIFKNMFDWVCNINIQERMRKGLKIPTDPNERMRLLSKAWRIRPISYKQFSNLVTGKNEYYTELVNINGKDDPLRKTLLIIDEAHKLYGGEDLSGNERPDMEKFKESLMHSYSHSKENSVKVLLMTATPITNDPMELIKLVNLCKEKNEQIPDEIDEFYKKFEVTSRGNFSNKGSLQYLNAITGNISYLSREADGRQFVKPVVTIVKVPMSTSGVSKSGLDDMKNEMNHRIRIEKDKLEELQDNYNDFKKEISQHKKTLTADCKGKPKAECLSYVKVAMERLEKELFSKKQDVVSQEENIKIITKNLKDDYRLINEKTKDDSSQQGILENKCLKKR